MPKIKKKKQEEIRLFDFVKKAATIIFMDMVLSLCLVVQNPPCGIATLNKFENIWGMKLKLTGADFTNRLKSVLGLKSNTK